MSLSFPAIESLYHEDATTAMFYSGDGVFIMMWSVNLPSTKAMLK